MTTGHLLDKEGEEGSVQLDVTTKRPTPFAGIKPSGVTEVRGNAPWTSDNHSILHTSPILVNEGSEARKRFEAGFDEFRRWFPAALCYSKIVPVDEVITLTIILPEDDRFAA